MASRGPQIRRAALVQQYAASPYKPVELADLGKSGQLFHAVRASSTGQQQR